MWTHPKHHFRRRGLSYPELCLGLAITAIVGAAIASFTFATAQAWRNTEAGISAETLTHVATARLNDIVHGARLLGACRGGSLDTPGLAPAGVLLWTRDSNGDGQIQTSEITLIGHDPVKKQLYIHTQPAPKIDITWSYAAFTLPTAIDSFAAKGNRQPIASHVDGAAMSVTFDPASADRPRLNYQLKTTVQGKVERFNGAVTMRAPVSPPT